MTYSSKYPGINWEVEAIIERTIHSICLLRAVICILRPVLLYTLQIPEMLTANSFQWKEEVVIGPPLNDWLSLQINILHQTASTKLISFNYRDLLSLGRTVCPRYLEGQLRMAAVIGRHKCVLEHSVWRKHLWNWVKVPLIHLGPRAQCIYTPNALFLSAYGPLKKQREEKRIRVDSDG